MPHLILDYSDGIDQTHDMQALCIALFDHLQADPALPDPASLKIRARPSPYSLSGAPQPGQLHATLWLLPGRDGNTKSRLADEILGVLAQHLTDVGSVSVDIQELNAAYTKRVL